MSYVALFFVLVTIAACTGPHPPKLRMCESDADCPHGETCGVIHNYCSRWER